MVEVLQEADVLQEVQLEIAVVQAVLQGGTAKVGAQPQEEADADRVISHAADGI